MEKMILLNNLIDTIGSLGNVSKSEISPEEKYLLDTATVEAMKILLLAETFSGQAHFEPDPNEADNIHVSYTFEKLDGQIFPNSNLVVKGWGEIVYNKTSHLTRYISQPGTRP